MVYATFKEEKKLWKRGCKSVACLDEAGRGPLAGPVVAAAVISPRPGLLISRSGLDRIKDSKQLSPKQREDFYNLITKNKNLKWGIGIVSEKVIDKINILEATKLAMEKAVNNLIKKMIEAGPQSVEARPPKIDYLILDGKMRLNLSIPQRSIVKADEKVLSCAAASILAKVTRDRIMARYHKKYPRYGFLKHKGYGTKLHYKMLKKIGPCVIHRVSFNLSS